MESWEWSMNYCCRERDKKSQKWSFEWREELKILNNRQTIAIDGLSIRGGQADQWILNPFDAIKTTQECVNIVQHVAFFNIIFFSISFQPLFGYKKATRRFGEKWQEEHSRIENSLWGQEWGRNLGFMSPQGLFFWSRLIPLSIVVGSEEENWRLSKRIKSTSIKLLKRV